MRYIITCNTYGGESFVSKASTKDQAMVIADIEAGRLENQSVVVTDTLTGVNSQIK